MKVPADLAAEVEAAGLLRDAIGFFEVLSKYGEVLVENGEMIEVL